LPETVATELEAIFSVVKNEDCYAKLVIDFTSSGYYDPGRTYGDPYYCYPPEGEDERLLDGNVGVWLDWKGVGGKRTKPDHTLSDKASDDLFEAYRERVESEELDHDDYDPPDRDDY